MAEATAKKKAAPKRAAAKRKAAPKKTAARKAAPKKTAPKRKAAKPDFAARAQAASRKAFLASLGFYGKAFDQVQEQFSSVQDELEARRKKADKLYNDLVKRGEKVEKEARKAVDDMELPKFDFELDSLADRSRIEAQLDKAKARFEELREDVRDSLGLKSAA
ncbi:MAG: hypothetical protein AAGI11_03235 [Pseudomonadota bacterium]